MPDDPSDFQTRVMAEPSPASGLINLLFRLIPATLLIGVGLNFFHVQVKVLDDRGAIPQPFEAVLWRGEKSEKITVSDGSVSLLRFRWNRMEVTDLKYVRSEITLKGRHPQAIIERNTELKLKDAAHGLPSVPQPGDPDPKNEHLPGH